MTTYDFAHIMGPQIDLIIVPLHANFGYRPAAEQSATVARLCRRASAAGFTGTVVLVWDSGGGRMAFLAPADCHSFLRSIDLGFVSDNINGEL